MNSDSHDLIQRHMAAQLTEDEAASLQTRLKADAALRRLYLHYMNLDVALEAQAGSRGRGMDLLRAMPMTENKLSGRWLSWRPLLAAAACVALLLIGAMFMLQRPARTRPDPAPVFASAQDTIARIPEPPLTSFPPWISSTDVMLEQSVFSP